MTQMQRAFSLAVRSPSSTRVETLPLQSEGRHTVTRAPPGQLLAGATGYLQSGDCCPQGGEQAVRGKAGAAPVAGMANSQGMPFLRSIPMGRQPQGVEGRTPDGPAPGFLLPHQPCTSACPGKPTWNLLLNYYSQN